MNMKVTYILIDCLFSAEVVYIHVLVYRKCYYTICCEPQFEDIYVYRIRIRYIHSIPNSIEQMVVTYLGLFLEIAFFLL